MLSETTIAAVATASGNAGVGVIRVSGGLVPSLLKKMLGKNILPKQVHVGPFYGINDQIIDEGIALYFKNPHSFTGEDVLELQGHGSPVVQNWILNTLFSYGVQMARPGEFSERAFLNGKKDLVEIEAVADLISAHSERAAKLAMRSMKGDFSAAIKALMEKLIQIRIFVEAAIDFPEEEIDFLSDSQLIKQFDALKQSMQDAQKAVSHGVLIREGIKIVLVGAPNGGKSSLLNWLTGEETAIVTEIPGTTRDVIRTSITLDGVPVHILDTAGLRETEDRVEQEGIRRAELALSEADHVLWVVDANASRRHSGSHRMANLDADVTVVMNKIDLTTLQPCEKLEPEWENLPTVYCSVKKDLGLDLLKKRILSQAGEIEGEEGQFLARSRHKLALERAVQCFLEAESKLRTKQGELVAESLKWSHQALGEIVGEFTTEDLLGEIFSSFCIGK